MTRKSLGLLVLTPVLFFALDKGLTTDGGGKEGRKKASRAESPSNGEQKTAVSDKTGTIDATNTISYNAGTGTAAVLSREEKLTAVRALKAKYETSEALEDFWKVDVIWIGDEERIDAATNEFLAAIEAKLEDENPADITLRSFSRCPSGYRVVIASVDDKATDIGYLCFDRGCDSQPLAMFRYNAAAGTADVLINDGTASIPLDEFISLYKKV